MKKILIIEDHADMRELLTWQIGLMGFAAVTARQGREGLQKAQSENPSLIILDIMMPSMDGWEAARELKANAATKDIPILAATALFRDADLQTVWPPVAALTSSSPLLFKSCKEKYRN